MLQKVANRITAFHVGLLIVLLVIAAIATMPLEAVTGFIVMLGIVAILYAYGDYVEFNIITS